MHYARTSIVKPVVEVDIGYEALGESFFADFQRTAFWLSMLNGAAGHTYGAESITFNSNPGLQRLTWKESMSLPGSNQMGLGAKLLRQYRWWEFEPHPEWVTPRGTTLLEPREEISGFDLGSWDMWNLLDS